MSRDTDITEEDVLRNAHSMLSKTRWAQVPEPDKNEMDPQTVLDCNIEGQAWLYNITNESEAWLTYHGEPKDLIQ